MHLFSPEQLGSDSTFNDMSVFSVTTSRIAAKNKLQKKLRMAMYV